MTKCEICGMELKDLNGLTRHIRNHKVKSKEYYDLYLKKDENDGKCLVCEKETKYNGMMDGYSRYCSAKCSANSIETKNKKKQTNLEKYGVEQVLQNKNIYNKMTENIKEKYGTDNVFKVKEIQEKQKETIKEKYNVDNVSQLDEVKDKKETTRLKSQTNKMDKILKYFDVELIDKYNLNNREILNFKCLKCGNTFENNYFNIQQGYGKCPICFPKYKSNDELELIEFIKSLNISNIVEGDKTILNGKELDILLPDKNLAIEYNGLYYHSETCNRDEKYHLDKTIECKKRNLKLIHIFEDEWVYKKDIVKNKLKEVFEIYDDIDLNNNDHIIKEINETIKNEFINKYDLQRNIESDINLGLYYNQNLTSIISFKKDNDIYEIANFCSSSNYNNKFIFDKLLSYFKDNYEWDEIILYADIRWIILNNINGFKMVNYINPKCWYVKGNTKYMENEINKEYNKYHKLWDCGYLKLSLTK